MHDVDAFSECELWHQALRFLQAARRKAGAALSSPWEYSAPCKASRGSKRCASCRPQGWCTPIVQYRRQTVLQPVVAVASGAALPAGRL